MRKEIKDLLDYTRYIITGNTNRIVFINSLIYYAQYLSIQDRWKPLVWSNFFNINGIPYMAPFIAEPKVDYSWLEQFDDTSTDMYITHYIQLALVDIVDIYKQMDIDGVKQFIGGICDIQGRPSVDPYHMLYYALKSKDKQDRLQAKQVMQNDEASKRYTKEVEGDDGEKYSIECTKYVS